MMITHTFVLDPEIRPYNISKKISPYGIAKFSIKLNGDSSTLRDFSYDFLVNKGTLRAGETVLVNGASGAVGSACVQIAHHIAREIVEHAAIDKHFSFMHHWRQDSG